MTEHETRGAAAQHPKEPPSEAAVDAGPPVPDPVVDGAPVDSAQDLRPGSALPDVDPPGPDGPVGPPEEPNSEGSDPGRSDPDEHAAKVEAWRQKSKKRTKPKRPFWVELPLLILIAFGLTFLIQTFVAKVYYVPSGSMEQTLHGVADGGDRILANKIVYDFRDPTPGDVVVFSGPPTWAPEANIPGPTSWFGKAMQSLGSVIGIAPPNEKDFVKRVIAVGGETVACCDAAGNVTINGQPLNESVYIYEPIDVRPG